jgi:N4-gp56 family major capsid protein
MFTWELDAQTGTYKNHAISNSLLEHASLNFVVAQFAQPESAFGKKMGETYNLYHYKNLDPPDDPVLEEQEDMPLDTLEMGTNSITVEEWGRGVQITDLSKQLSKFDPEEAAQKKLMEQMKYSMDIGASDALKTAKVCAIPTSSTVITWDTDGTPSTAASNNITLAHIEVIRDYMANNLHVPHRSDGSYVGIFTTKGLRGLKSDDDIVDWHQYLSKGDLLFNSEIGKVEEIRLVEITLSECFTNGVGTSSVLGEGVVFGEDALALVEAMTPRLVYEPNYRSQFGRFHAVAWRGILKYGLYWATANDREARVIRVTSS